MRRAFLVSVAATATVAAFLIAGGPARAAVAFQSPVVVSPMNDSEPGIDVARDGTIYVNAIPGLSVPGPSPSQLWRSTDGSNWTLTPPGARANFPGGGDFDIDVDKTSGSSTVGNLYSSDLWLGSSTVGVSTDKGNSWTANPYSTPVQDRQWIASGGNGRVYHVTHQIPSGIVVAVSVDNGVSYPAQNVALTPADQTGCVCPPGTLIAEGGALLGDKVGVIAYTSTGGIVFGRSTNGAVSFSARTVQGPTSSDTGAAFPVVANAGGNRLVAVWQQLTGSASIVRLATSTDWGNTWSTPKTIVSTGTSLYPWVAASGSKISVSLFHTDAVAATPDSVPQSASWYETYLESTDFGGTFTAPVAADPTVVKTGPICTAGINCNADRELGDFQSLTLDGSARANLTWARSVNGANDTEIRFVRQL